MFAMTTTGDLRVKVTKGKLVEQNLTNDSVYVRAFDERKRVGAERSTRGPAAQPTESKSPLQLVQNVSPPALLLPPVAPSATDPIVSPPAPNPPPTSVIPMPPTWTAERDAAESPRFVPPTTPPTTPMGVPPTGVPPAAVFPPPNPGESQCVSEPERVPEPERLPGSRDPAADVQPDDAAAAAARLPAIFGPATPPPPPPMPPTAPTGPG